MVRTPRVLAAKKESLEKRLARLSADYAAVNDQIDREGDGDKRNQLQRKADDFLTQMEQTEIELDEVEKELNQQESPEKKINQIHLNIQANLPKIDFQKAMNTVDKIMSQFGREGGAALFLLEDSYSMAGELCISRIKERIKYSQETGKVQPIKHIQIDISSTNSYDEMGLIKSIGGYFDVHFETKLTPENYINKVIKTICQSLQDWSVIFIDLRKWHCLQSQEKIIPWFVDNFWCPLIEECQATKQREALLHIKFIAVIDSELKQGKECINLPCYCTQDNFSSQKILKLPLIKWTQKDIKKWLENHLEFPVYQSDEKAKEIYQKTSRGIPRLVSNVLEREFM